MPRSPLPKVGQFVSLRGRLWLVENEPGSTFDGHRLACVDDDASGDDARVLWSAEIDARLRDEEAWGSLATGRGDDPRAFAAYLRTVKWRTATAADRAPGDVVGGRERLGLLIAGLLDDWVAVAAEQTAVGTVFSYDDRPHRLLHPPLDPAPPADPAHRRFEVGWSMRDVEPGVLVKPRGPDGERVAGAGDMA